MTRLIRFALVWFFSLPALAADPPAAPPPVWIDATQTPYGPIMVQQAPPPPYRDYQMNRILTPEERKRWLQLAMPMTANMAQMDAREAINHFAVKHKAKPGLSFDEVVEAMLQRANLINLKFVGKNQMWKDFRAVLNDHDAPRVETFSFCDIAAGRDLLRVVPEMAVFMPCRITVMEDADKNIWVMTLDWEVTGIELAGKQAGLTPEMRKSAMAIREKLENVMLAGANGDL